MGMGCASTGITQKQGLVITMKDTRVSKAKKDMASTNQGQAEINIRMWFIVSLLLQVKLSTKSTHLQVLHCLQDAVYTKRTVGTRWLAAKPWQKLSPFVASCSRLFWLHTKSHKYDRTSLSWHGSLWLPVVSPNWRAHIRGLKKTWISLLKPSNGTFRGFNKMQWSTCQWIAKSNFEKYFHQWEDHYNKYVEFEGAYSEGD